MNVTLVNLPAATPPPASPAPPPAPACPLEVRDRVEIRMANARAHADAGDLAMGLGTALGATTGALVYGLTACPAVGLLVAGVFAATSICMAVHEDRAARRSIEDAHKINDATGCFTPEEMRRLEPRGC